MTDYPTPYCHKCLFVYDDFRCKYCSMLNGGIPTPLFFEYTPTEVVDDGQLPSED